MPVNALGALPNALMPERETMRSTARCPTPPPVAPLIAMFWLSACAMGDSDAPVACPPVVEYSATDQARTADEVDALTKGAIVVRMLSDYGVLPDQVRV